jgi:hypothetical protein
MELSSNETKMLRLTRIEEGACYVTDTTKLYVAWSMLCSSSKLFWGCGIIQNLDQAKSLSYQAYGDKPDVFSELIELLQNIESPVLDAVRIIICFENYFKAKLLLGGYVIHQMDLYVCQQLYPQFMRNTKKDLLQKTTPIFIDDIKQAEKHDHWATKHLRTLTKRTIGMSMLIKQPEYREIYLRQVPDDQRLFAMLQRLNETRNTLHFLNIEYIAGEIRDFAFLRDYVSAHIDALVNEIIGQNKSELDVGRDEVRHLQDIEFD